MCQRNLQKNLSLDVRSHTTFYPTCGKLSNQASSHPIAKQKPFLSSILGNLDKKGSTMKRCWGMCAPDISLRWTLIFLWGAPDDISFETGRPAKNPFNTALGNVRWGGWGRIPSRILASFSQFGLLSVFVVWEKLEEPFMSLTCPPRWETCKC